VLKSIIWWHHGYIAGALETPVVDSLMRNSSGEAAGASRAGGRVTVTIAKALIIDDDPSIRRISQISLTRVAKWEVIVAASGPEGISEMLKNKPDVVLLDVMMPGMDGPTTLAQIKKSEFNQVPVIFITAKVMQHEVEQYLALGAAGVICKPFDPVTLAGQVSSIVDGWSAGSQ
jgi:CheY-like chemotaxis protein